MKIQGLPPFIVPCSKDCNVRFWPQWRVLFWYSSPIVSTWNHCIENGRRLNVLERVCTALICQPCPLLLTLSPLIIELQTHLHQIRLDQEVCRQGSRPSQTKTAVTEIFILHCFNTSVNLWLKTRSRCANVKIFLTLAIGSVVINACVEIGTC